MTGPGDKKTSTLKEKIAKCVQFFPFITSIERKCITSLNKQTTTRRKKNKHTKNKQTNKQTKQNKKKRKQHCSAAPFFGTAALKWLKGKRAQPLPRAQHKLNLHIESSQTTAPDFRKRESDIDCKQKTINKADSSVGRHCLICTQTSCN